MKSILQEGNTHCFLCGMNASIEPLDLHHVFNKSDKKKSEEYGLMVYLHHRKCHIFGKESVHQNAEVNNRVKAHAQRVAMQHYGWSVDDWLKIFGKNYL
jgi:hypothetical protein